MPIVDEAVPALQQLGWPKGPRHVQHMYNIGQSDMREAVTLADCWSHQPGSKIDNADTGIGVVARRLIEIGSPLSPPAELGFDGEPPKALARRQNLWPRKMKPPRTA